MNGWQRLGVVASSIWLVIGFVWGWTRITVLPGESLIGITLLFTLLPIVIGWVWGGMIVWTYRWVRAGFEKSARSSAP